MFKLQGFCCNIKVEFGQSHVRVVRIFISITTNSGDIIYLHLTGLDIKSEQARKPKKGGSVTSKTDDTLR